MARFVKAAAGWAFGLVWHGTLREGRRRGGVSARGRSLLEPRWCAQVWETRVVVRRDERSTHRAAASAAGVAPVASVRAHSMPTVGESGSMAEQMVVAYRTDTDTETLKVSGLTGAEQEHRELERLLQSRRELLGD